MTPKQEVCEYKGGGYQPPPFNIRFLLVSIGLIGVWAAAVPLLHYGSLAVLAVIELTYLFGCTRTKRSVLAIVPATFLPFAWLLWINDPWNDHRWHWIGMWLQIPGLLAIVPFRNQLSMLQNETTAGILAPMVTVIYLLTAITIGRISPYWRMGTAAIVLTLGILMAIMSYSLFRG